MKLKHNKKRNTAFLFEALIREMAKTVLSEKKDVREKIKTILKEHFKKGSLLHTELGLYKTIYETRGADLYTAERLVQEVQKSHGAMSKKDLFNEQSVLINEINKTVTAEVYNNFVPSYKGLATINQLFQEGLKPKQRVALERKLIRSMITRDNSSHELQEMAHTDSLVYNSFVKRFNETYDTSLLSEQKELLNKYIMSVGDNGLQFKVYLNSQIGTLKERVEEAFSLEEIKDSEILQERLGQVRDRLDSFSTKRIDSEMIENVLKIQNLVKELYD
jgi:hypothetical protein